MKRMITLVIGWGFVVLGIIGCFLPVLQGILFMTVGFFFLAEESPFFKKHLTRLEQRYPKHMRRANLFREAMKRRLRRLLRRHRK